MIEFLETFICVVFVFALYHTIEIHLKKKKYEEKMKKEGAVNENP